MPAHLCPSAECAMNGHRGSFAPQPLATTVRYDPVYQRLVVPIRPNVEAELFVPYPMSTADWDQFQSVLEAMKPGLVRDTAFIPNRHPED